MLSTMAIVVSIELFSKLTDREGSFILRSRIGAATIFLAGHSVASFFCATGDANREA